MKEQDARPRRTLSVLQGGGAVRPHHRGEPVVSHHGQSGEPARDSRLAELFKIFGDPTRIRILFALFSGDRCVGVLADELQMTQSAISHQLRILKQAHLVRSQRTGQRMVYSLADGHVRTIIDQGLRHIEE